jgi:hypothetical protein
MNKYLRINLFLLLKFSSIINRIIIYSSKLKGDKKLSGHINIFINIK